jgi:hypothetical protein
MYVTDSYPRIVAQLVKKFTAFSRTLSIINIFTSIIHHLTCSELVDPSAEPHTLYFKINFNIIFSSTPVSSK